MFRRLMYGFDRFMQGRYGVDELSKVMFVVGIIFLLLSYINVLWFLSFPALAIEIWMIFRSYSRNIPKRLHERDVYMKLIAKPKKFISLQKMKWRDRKTFIYFKCSGCGASLRVPKRKGRIEICCPKCKTKAIKTT